MCKIIIVSITADTVGGSNIGSNGCYYVSD